MNIFPDKLTTAAQTCLDNLLERHAVLRSLQESLQQAANMLAAVAAGPGTLLLCGNGGSAADCDHIVGELLKGFKLARPLPDSVQAQLGDHGELGWRLAAGLQQGIRAVSLTQHTSFLTAVANDNGGDLGFAQALWSMAQPQDLLICLSTSGNSMNVLLAATAAKALNLPIIALTGKSGGKLAELADVLIAVPETETALIQELHLPIYHALCAAIEQQCFGSDG